MSEPSQLFVQIHIGKTAFESFLSHKVLPLSEFQEWLNWLDGKQYYGGKITAEQLATYNDHGMSVREWLNEWTDGEYAESYAPVSNFYDEHAGIWTFAVEGFSENYGAYIRSLNVLRQVALFKDTDASDFILIFPLLFGGGMRDAEAMMEITRGNSIFVTSVPDDFSGVAIRILEEMNEGVDD